MVRVKRRYVLFEVIPSDANLAKSAEVKLTEREIVHAMRKMIYAKYGDFGLGSVLKSLHVKRFSPATRVGIVTVQRGPHALLMSSMPFIKKIKDTNCSIKTIHLSGTIRGCLRKLRVYHRMQIKEHEGDLSPLERGFQELHESLAAVIEEEVEDV